MFDNSKLNYAKIIQDGKVILEGWCTHWEIPGNNTFIKLIIDDVEYLTSLSNVLLIERGETSKQQ